MVVAMGEPWLGGGGGGQGQGGGGGLGLEALRTVNADPAAKAKQLQTEFVCFSLLFCHRK